MKRIANRMVTVIFLLLASLVVFADAPVAGVADVREDARNHFSDTQSSVTVKIEKVTVERIIDGESWLRNQIPVRKDLPYSHPKSFRVVKLFVSTLGPVDYHAFYPESMDCEFGEPRIGKKYHGKAVCFPQKLREQLPDIDIDSSAHGVVHWMIVEDGTDVELLFPVRASCKLRTESGEMLTFTLSILAP